MNYRLFDETNRTDTGPMQHNETHYEYLNRSARPEAERIRSLLEDWFSRYPKEKHANFLIRFRDKKEHDSTFFELYIHEILLKQGFTCKAHPEIAGAGTYPEFLVTGMGLNFYVEATIPDLPQDYALHKKLYDELVNELKKISILLRHHYLVTHEGLLRNRPSLKGFKDWLETRPPAGSSFEPKLKQCGAKITIILVESNEPSVDIMYNSESQGATIIRKAIDKKATKYGKLAPPYLIAINVKDFVLKNFTVASAIFGDLCVQINPKTGESTTGRDFRTAKLLKGYPQNTRVSGIILLDNLVAWNIAQCTPVLWHNPWAGHPFPPELWQLPQQIPKEVYEKKKGKAVLALLGLPPNWPEG